MTFQRRSILCPKCRALISGDEPRCPHCGFRRPGSWWNRFLVKSFREADQIVKGIIYVNIGMYGIALLLNPASVSFSLNPFSLLSLSNRSLLLLGATGSIPIDQFHRWWTLISANYLHGSILHLLFNLLAFKQLAPLIVREFGYYRMMSIYTLGGTTGFFVSYLVGIPFTIGASAAVCSLIGAAIYYSKSRGGIYGQVLYRQLGAWAIGILIFGLIVPGINNWGHGGGFLAGILAAYLLGYAESMKETRFHRFLGMTCIIVTAAVLSWAIITSVIARFWI